ncbi:MAG: CDGSH iron-sulfur domain-containing protein [Acidiferrobacterales bacterium]
MDLPISPQNGPYAVEVQEGETYSWCSCGLSATQPWCDGSHEGTGFKPIDFIAPITAIFYMCGCKQSDNAPYCFGTCRGHGRWPEG